MTRTPDPVRDIRRLQGEIELLSAHVGGMRQLLDEVTEQARLLRDIVNGIDVSIAAINTKLTVMAAEGVE